jgi:hypothetical protein
MRGQARLITPEGLDMSSPFDEPISLEFLQRAVGGDIEIAVDLRNAEFASRSGERARYG